MKIPETCELDPAKVSGQEAWLDGSHSGTGVNDRS
jgi:hypothetical protein